MSESFPYSSRYALAECITRMAIKRKNNEQKGSCKLGNKQSL